MALRPNIAAGQNRAQSETGLDRLSLKCPFSQMMAIGFYGTFRDKLPYNQERILSYYFVAGDAFWRPNKSFSCSSFVLEGGMISGKCIEQGVRVMGMVWEEILVVCQASASVDVDLT